jgi:hypothetical protein
VAIALSARPPWPPNNARAHKLFEPDLNRRGSGGSEGTVYLRWANAAMLGMIGRTMRRAFSRSCLPCPSAKDQTNVKQDRQNPANGTTARRKVVRPMKQTRSMILVASEDPIRPTNAFQLGCRCTPLAERDCQEASRLPQMAQPVLCS